MITAIITLLEDLFTFLFVTCGVLGLVGETPDERGFSATWLSDVPWREAVINAVAQAL